MRTTCTAKFRGGRRGYNDDRRVCQLRSRAAEVLDLLGGWADEWSGVVCASTVAGV